MKKMRRQDFMRLVIGTSAVTVAGAQGTIAFAQDAESTPDTELGSELPLPDLPTMNEQGFVFALESSFDGDYGSVASEATVYAMTLEQTDAAAFDDLKGQLGIDGETQDQGGGSFAAEGNGSLFVTPGLVQYVSAAEVPEGDVPADAEAVAFGREWLRQTQLLPANIGEGAVETRIAEPARVIVAYKPVTPAPLISAYPAITITMGPRGSILEASFRWAEISASDTYQLRGAEVGFGEVAERRSYLQTQLPSDTFPDGSSITGAATFTTISIAYTSSGIPGEQQYLQPIYQFNGSLVPEGSETDFPIVAYVPAISNSQQPVG